MNRGDRPLGGGGVAFSTGGDCWAGVPGASSSLELPPLVASEASADAVDCLSEGAAFSDVETSPLF